MSTRSCSAVMSGPALGTWIPELVQPCAPSTLLSGEAGPHLVVSRHEDVRDVLRHASLSADRSRFPAFRRMARKRGHDVEANMRSLLVMDPPEHTRIRKRVGEDLRGRIDGQLEAEVRKIAGELLDARDGTGPFDLVQAFTQPLPARALAVLLGLAREDHARFCAWSAALTRPLVRRENAVVLARAKRAERELGDFLLREVAARRRARRDDLIGDLVDEARDEAGVLGNSELLALLRLLLVAGHETTTRALTTGTALLLAGEAWSGLGAQTDSIETAIEELLRLATPIRAVARFAAEPVEFREHSLPRGARVTAWLDAANRDPKVFDAPDGPDLGRDPNPHLSFGFGTHFCLGADLARLEMRIGLEVLLERFPALTLAESRPCWSPGALTCELRRLRVDPGG